MKRQRRRKYKEAHLLAQGRLKNLLNCKKCFYLLWKRTHTQVVESGTQTGAEKLKYFPFLKTIQRTSNIYLTGFQSYYGPVTFLSLNLRWVSTADILFFAPLLYCIIFVLYCVCVCAREVHTVPLVCVMVPQIKRYQTQIDILKEFHYPDLNDGTLAFWTLVVIDSWKPWDAVCFVCRWDMNLWGP